MNRYQAKQMVDSGDFKKDDLLEILRTARVSITRWEVTSTINPSLSRGTAFNIMWKGVSAMRENSSRGLRLIAINILREFGAAAGRKPPRRKSRPSVPVCHQEPIDVEPPHD